MQTTEMVRVKALLSDTVFDPATVGGALTPAALAFLAARAIRSGPRTTLERPRNRVPKPASAEEAYNSQGECAPTLTGDAT